jgi:hypothetical protein
LDQVRYQAKAASGRSFVKERTMKISAVILAALAVGTAVPAFAAWDRIGSVDFSRRDTHGVQYGNFGGPVEALGLRARGSDLHCNAVTATFGNGHSQQVFRGELPEGREVKLDLPGGERRVDRLDFDCQPIDARNGSVAVSADVVADVGQYRDDWRKSPDWERTWSKVFDWAKNR